MFQRNISGAVAVADQSQKYQSRVFFREPYKNEEEEVACAKPTHS